MYGEIRRRINRKTYPGKKEEKTGTNNYQIATFKIYHSSEKLLENVMGLLFVINDSIVHFHSAHLCQLKQSSKLASL